MRSKIKKNNFYDETEKSEISVMCIEAIFALRRFG